MAGVARVGTSPFSTSLQGCLLVFAVGPLGGGLLLVNLGGFLCSLFAGTSLLSSHLGVVHKSGEFIIERWHYYIITFYFNL